VFLFCFCKVASGATTPEVHGGLNRLKLRNAGAALSDPTGFVLNLKMADT